MVKNISPAQYISGKLRYAVHNGDLTDYNAVNRAAQFGNWIFPDSPMIVKLLNNKNNFPRIAVTSMDSSTIKRLGMQSTQYHDTTQLAINIYSPPTLTCEVDNTASENHTYNTGTNIYELDNLPVSIIGNTIDGTKDGGPWSFDKDVDYELVDNDYDGFYDSVSWLGVDSPDDGSVFTCAYNRKATGAELVRIIGQDVDKYIRENWLTWAGEDHELYYYKVVTAKPVDLDEFINVNRYEIFCTFTGIDIGKSI